MDTVYDIPLIRKAAKKKLLISILHILIFIGIAVMGTVLLIIYSTALHAFIICVTLSVASLFMLGRAVGKLRFFSYTASYGKILHVFREITKTYAIKGIGIGAGLGIGLGGKNRYGKYNFRSVRITVYIENDSDGKIYAYQLNRVSPYHESYYEAKDNRYLHILGTRYPIKLATHQELFLCPFCGEFNAAEEKGCKRCKNKIFK